MSEPIAASVLSLNNVEVVYDYVSLAIKGVSLDVPEGLSAAIATLVIDGTRIENPVLFG